MITLLQLQGAYDSNSVAARFFLVSVDLRGSKASDIPAIFDKHLIEEVTDRRGSIATEAFSYGLFRPMSIDRLNMRFTRYVFARVERLLALGMCQTPRHTLRDLVTARGSKSGFHVEHVLSRNAENIAFFDDDAARFDQERNRLGGVLLLKGKDNISSGNEPFSSKLKSYANTLLWNETLREDTYKSKLDFKEFMGKNRLAFKPLATFGPEQLEERQKLLFDLCKLIWASAAKAAS